LKDGVEAYQYLVRAVDLLPARDDIKVLLADLSFKAMVRSRQAPKSLYDLVAKLSDQLLTRNPHSYDGWSLKGALAVADKKFKAADEFFRKLNEAKPMQPELCDRHHWLDILQRKCRNFVTWIVSRRVPLGTPLLTSRLLHSHLHAG